MDEEIRDLCVYSMEAFSHRSYPANLDHEIHSCAIFRDVINSRTLIHRVQTFHTIFKY